MSETFYTSEIVAEIGFLLKEAREGNEEARIGAGTLLLQLRRGWLVAMACQYFPNGRKDEGPCMRPVPMIRRQPSRRKKTKAKRLKVRRNSGP